MPVSFLEKLDGPGSWPTKEWKVVLYMTWKTIIYVQSMIKVEGGSKFYKACMAQ